MKIAIPTETRQNETRVAATPETVKKYVALGAAVAVQRGAGIAASVTDEAFVEAGATIVDSSWDAVQDADMVLKVAPPTPQEVGEFRPGAYYAGLLNPFAERDTIEAMVRQNVTAFAMEFMPRITRAQSMDVLSSQSNLSGYLAVIEAAALYNRAFPQMMTAAGTIPPAKVFVMGAGVAGLQAIATAKRLGAQVSATDVRPAAREQVESLAAKFVMVDSEETREAETSGGYAREMSEEYKRKQAELIAQTIAKQDVVVTTALIPGRPAPLLVTDEMVASMKPGSVIVDLAVEQGGNVAPSRLGDVVEAHGVLIAGYANMPGRIAADASALYARNLHNFLALMIDKDEKAFKVDWEDDIMTATAVTRDGAIVHASLAPAPGPSK
ncbi:MAG: Re/Si-specific NAD(P)(+) transhydrogenase subunit alpha [Alphaproteobacteria bacterium]